MKSEVATETETFKPKNVKPKNVKPKNVKPKKVTPIENCQAQSWGRIETENKQLEIESFNFASTEASQF